MSDVQYVSRTQAAKELNMSLSTFDRRRADGLIGTHYFSPGIPMFSMVELDEYKKNCRVVRTADKKPKKKRTNKKRRAPVDFAWTPGEKLV